MNTETNTKLAMKVSWVTIVINILLSAFKFFAGILLSVLLFATGIGIGLSDPRPPCQCDHLYLYCQSGY